MKHVMYNLISVCKSHLIIVRLFMHLNMIEKTKLILTVPVHTYFECFFSPKVRVSEESARFEIFSLRVEWKFLALSDEI